MVELEVTLPARPNSIPVVSTSLFSADVVPQLMLGQPAHTNTSSATATSSSSIATCSTLNLDDGHSFLAHSLQLEGDTLHLHSHPLYQHLSRASCQWHFRMWLPLSALIQHCGGQRASRQEEEIVSVQAVSVHVHFVESDGAFAVEGNQSVVLALLKTPGPAHTTTSSIQSTAPLLPPPVHTLSQSGDSLPHVFPLAISEVPEDEDALFQLLIVSAAPPQHLFQISNHSHFDPRLLYTDMETGSQVWALLLDRESQSLMLEMTAWGTTACTYCAPQVHHFSLLLGVAEVGKGASVSFLLNAEASLLEDGNKPLSQGQ